MKNGSIVIMVMGFIAITTGIIFFAIYNVFNHKQSVKYLVKERCDQNNIHMIFDYGIALYKENKDLIHAQFKDGSRQERFNFENSWNLPNGQSIRWHIDIEPTSSADKLTFVYSINEKANISRLFFIPH